MLILLLPLLAYLQYQWQGQVSLALRAQMQEQMQRAANQFNDDFGLALTDVYKSFQPVLPEKGTPDERPVQLRRQFEELYARWNRTTQHPRLIRNVFLLAPFVESPAAAERLDRSTGKFEPARGDARLCALLIEADAATGRATSVQRLMLGE